MGISKAMTLLPPASFIQAGAVAATGAAQLINIAKAGNGNASISGPSGSVGSLVSSVESQVGQSIDTNEIDKGVSQQEALQNAIAGLNLNVSVSEINEVQRSVSVSEEDSQI